MSKGRVRQTHHSDRMGAGFRLRGTEPNRGEASLWRQSIDEDCGVLYYIEYNNNFYRYKQYNRATEGSGAQ